MKERKVFIFWAIVISLIFQVKKLYPSDLPYPQINLEDPTAELQLQRNFEQLEETTKQLQATTTKIKAETMSESDTEAGLHKHSIMTTDVHGVEGSVAGTENTQTLINKTILKEDNQITADDSHMVDGIHEIGRASCRERV